MLGNLLHEMKARLTGLEQMMAINMNKKVLTQYGDLLEQYQLAGGYEIEAKIASISSGLKITQLLLKQPDILLLDEPTNHLDLAAIEWLEDYLHYFKGTVLIVSHDYAFLNSVVNKF